MTRARSESARILSQGRLTYLSIDVGKGPLVTPVLYGALGEDVWFVTNRHAVKAKVLAKRPAAGWTVTVGERAVVATGRADLFSLSDLRATFARAALLPHVPVALASWVKRNPRQVAGFLGDSVTTPSRAMPQDVVLVRLRPTTSTAMPVPSAGPAADVGTRLTSALPEQLRHLPAGPRGVLGLVTPRGPLALPAAWDGAIATVPVAADALVEGAADRACITFDDPVRTRPTQQRGVVLRGDGHLVAGGGELSWSLAPSRVTYWDGFDTHTTVLAPDPVLTH